MAIYQKLTVRDAIPTKTMRINLKTGVLDIVELTLFLAVPTDMVLASER